MLSYTDAVKMTARLISVGKFTTAQCQAVAALLGALYNIDDAPRLRKDIYAALGVEEQSAA